MKVSELIGAELDYWVALAIAGKVVGREEFQKDDYILRGDEFYTTDRMDVYTLQSGALVHWSPSTVWDVGGPIIERERIAIAPREDERLGKWWIATRYAKYPPPYLKLSEIGPTPLIAAMRAFVASKLGDEVTPSQLQSTEPSPS